MTDTPITKLTSLEITGKNPFTAPSLTTEERDSISADILKNGNIILNTTLGFFQVYQNNVWLNMSTSQDVVPGTGLDATPFILPKGENATVQGHNSGNARQGHMYYDTTSDTIRVRIGGEQVWKEVQLQELQENPVNKDKKTKK